MPYRISHAPGLFNDALAMMAVFFANSSAVIGGTDWGNAIGPYGGYFISLAMLGLFIQRDRASTKTAERRHAETIAMQKANGDQLMGLTVEGIKAQGRATVAIESVDRTLQYLSKEMGERPCQAKTFKEKP
jgi:hypothetical protein